MPKMKIDEIKVGVRIRSTDANVDDLVESMRANGQWVPIQVDEEGNLVDGWRRLTAAKKEGWEEIEVSIVSRLEGLKARIREHQINYRRGDFTQAEEDAHLVAAYDDVSALLLAESVSASEAETKLDVSMNASKPNSQEKIAAYLQVPQKTLSNAIRRHKARISHPDAAAAGVSGTVLVASAKVAAASTNIVMSGGESSSELKTDAVENSIAKNTLASFNSAAAAELNVSDVPKKDTLASLREKVAALEAEKIVQAGVFEAEKAALAAEIAKHLAQIDYLEECGEQLFDDAAALREHAPAAEQWESLADIMRSRYGLIEDLEFIYEALNCRRYLLEFEHNPRIGAARVAKAQQWVLDNPYEGPVAIVMEAVE